MARPATRRKPTTTAPHRSPSAAQAHAANKVTWTIDLAQAPSRVTERAVASTSRSVMTLGVVAGTVWVYDIARILTH